MIAALFVDCFGIYASIPEIDLWCKERDARFYNGENPVIAHPPCQLWGKFAKINYIRWGGEHNRPGNDGGCFASALSNVRRCGGVLEHPAMSYAWKEYGLQKPVGVGEWQQCNGNEYVCEVWQSDYGHKARKRTWLYYCGVNKPPPMRANLTPTKYQIGFHDQRGKSANKPTISGRQASATPYEFALALIALAKTTAIDAQMKEGLDEK